MSAELQEEIEQAVESLLADLSVDCFPIYTTRSFWNYGSEDDFLEAYKEAAQYYREAIDQLTKILGCDGVALKRNENGFPNWLSSDEACFWYLKERTFVLYWLHEDKELPVIVWLYAFDPKQASHRKLDQKNESLFSYRIYYESEENKVRMLNGNDTTAKVREIILQCFLAFPSRRIAEALIRNRDKDYGNFTARDIYEAVLRQSQKLDEFGDAYPLSTEDFELVEGSDEAGIVTLLTSSETRPAVRTRAALKVWYQPSERTVQALEQSKNQIFDRHVIPNIESLIHEIQLRLQL